MKFQIKYFITIYIKICQHFYSFFPTYDFICLFFDKFTYKAQALYNLTQNFEHKSIWDYEILSKKMSEIGFKDIVKKKYKEGENLDLLLDLVHRRPGTLYIECKS